MRGRVLASLPADNGKQIHYAHGCTLTVEAEVCHACGTTAATVVIQGETDSFGFEPVFLCEECHVEGVAQRERWANALDVEDREPKAGHVFWVSECTNHDGHGDWMRSFRSFREATAYYRRIEEKAASYCGLYPGKGIQEIPCAKAEERLERERRRFQKEMEWLEEQERLDAEWLAGQEDQDRDDDWDDDWEVAEVMENAR